MQNQALYDLKSAFLKEWPIERLKTMALHEYTNLDKQTSFCYWLESITNDVGSAWGGSSYKFGIFKRLDLTSQNYNKKRRTDGEYSWYGKYGDNREEVFEKVRNIVVDIAQNSAQDKLQAIDGIDLGDTIKWKIAFLYGDFNLINIFKKDNLRKSAEYLGYSGEDSSFSVLNRYILSKKGNRDFFDFAHELWEASNTMPNDTPVNAQTSKNSTPLNQILYGPPGTGKTYHTINEALEIIDPNFEFDQDREQIKEAYQALVKAGRIMFTTFHQSMSYEDFVEGIKPVEPNEEDAYLKYAIEDGIFKNICSRAEASLKTVEAQSDDLTLLTQQEFDQAQFYKISLGNKLKSVDEEIFEYCIANSCITIGYGNSIDFSDTNGKSIKAFGKEKGLEGYSLNVVNRFAGLLKKGDYVVVSYGLFSIRAIGKVVGDYEYTEESPLPHHSHHNHSRKVEWLFQDKIIEVSEIYEKQLSQQTIYNLDKKALKQDFFIKEKRAKAPKLPKKPKNYVLIIDEINRGNVSAIFGELITLIEKDKRVGADEELSVMLPYSKQEFSVPKNVYIIGTMNTADRSIEALDTALRRRFSFTEMRPDPELLADTGTIGTHEGMIENIDVVKLLDTINRRIEKLIDKDHQIGHAYFLNIDTLADLKIVFRDKVIPLLEEYFFGDLGKISLVLGKSFIAKNNTTVGFAKDNEYDESLAQDLASRAVYTITSEDQWNFEAIYA